MNCLKISYDPEANAVYVMIKEASPGGTGQTEVAEDGVIVDTDESGHPRGYEFLQARSGPPLDGVPLEIAEAITRFVADGYLSRTEYVRVEY